MSADLPMFGNPMTQERTGRGCSPRFARFALMATAEDSSASRSGVTPPPSFPSVQKALMPWALKCSVHSRRSAGWMESERLMTRSRGLDPTQVGT